MADDDLPTRLHWPADPLDAALTERPAGAGAAPSAPVDGAADVQGAPRWVLGERNDVTLLRQEVADLRHALDDLADRVQLRQLKASLEELRAEFISLRRVVVEWPELDQLTSEVAAIHSSVLDLQERKVPDDSAVLAVLGEVQAGIEALGSARTPVAALAPIVEELGAARDELASLREEVVSLRRRITLRGQVAEPTLDEEQLERLVESVVARVVANMPPPTPPPTPPATRRRR